MQSLISFTLTNILAGLCDSVTLVLPSDITNGVFQYPVRQNHTVLYYQEDVEEMYVGGTDFVLKLDVNDYHIIEVSVFGANRFWTRLFLSFCFAVSLTHIKLSNALLMGSQLEICVAHPGDSGVCSEGL